MAIRQPSNYTFTAAIVIDASFFVAVSSKETGRAAIAAAEVSRYTRWATTGTLLASLWARRFMRYVLSVTAAHLVLTPMPRRSKRLRHS